MEPTSTDTASSSSQAGSSKKADKKRIGPNAPVCIIVLGMAGSGKTTFVKTLADITYLHYNPYIINLDPACRTVPYLANIDIRDTINYKQVMKKYKLGPNGGIVTSLNLFATKFEKCLQLLQKAGNHGCKLGIIDTPGQIEVFTWSASGTIITETLASTFPTIVIYVMDVVRSTSPTTFMSNMLYACSILYRCRLPFIVVLNKIDLQDHDFAIEWMTDFEAFQDALRGEQHFISTLTSTMSLTLEEFYRELKTVGISSTTGVGFDKLLELIAQAAVDYETGYKVEYLKARQEKAEKDAEETRKKLENVEKSSCLQFVPLVHEEAPPEPYLSEIFLSPYHDDDDVEVEEVAHAFNDISIEDRNFEQYVKKFKNAQLKKAQKKAEGVKKLET